MPQCLPRSPCLWISVLILWIGSLPVHAQEVNTTVGGTQPLLRLVPTQAPRPAEGTDATEQFQTAPSKKPVASFIDSLKGNDAAVEVIVGQGKLLPIRHARDIAAPMGNAVVAVGDPTILEFQLLPNPQFIRMIGLRAGVTDLSITTPDGQTVSLEVHVVYDLSLLRAQLAQTFPTARLRMAQLREHVIVEGEAHSSVQVGQIIQTLQAYLDSVQVAREVEGERGAGSPEGRRADPNQKNLPGDNEPVAGPETGGPRRVRATFRPPQIVNLIRVPGVQQVMLKVQIAELNRTALREVGADILGVNPNNGNLMGTQLAGGTVSAESLLGLGGLSGLASGATGPATTAFGIFPSGHFAMLLRALRENAILTVLAEPNLIALSGHHANFLAGGEFPVPVPQGGLTNNVTIQFKEFGVRVDFVPYVLEDETIRLTVTPEVSSIDFALGTTLVQGGTPVPGLNTRRTTTTVELRQGHTLAIAGLLKVDMEAKTSRFPGLGDLPYIGPLFSNTSHKRVERELVVLVTPFLVQPLSPDQVGPLPGESIKDPNDMEFYLMNRIEGRTRQVVRPTTEYEIPRYTRRIRYDQEHCNGPVGFSKVPPTFHGPVGSSQ